VFRPHRFTRSPSRPCSTELLLRRLLREAETAISQQVEIKKKKNFFFYLNKIFLLVELIAFKTVQEKASDFTSKLISSFQPEVFSSIKMKLKV
jgi:hypothetical protein